MLQKNLQVFLLLVLPGFTVVELLKYITMLLVMLAVRLLLGSELGWFLYLHVLHIYLSRLPCHKEYIQLES